MTRRLLLSFVSITAFVLLVLEVPLGFSFATAERRRLETSVQHDALSAAIRAEEFLESGPVGATVPTLQQLADRYQSDAGGRLLVVDSRGIVVADSQPLVTGAPGATPPNYGRRPEIAQALGGREVKGTRYSRTLGTDLLYVAVPVAKIGGEVASSCGTRTARFGSPTRCRSCRTGCSGTGCSSRQSAPWCSLSCSSSASCWRDRSFGPWPPSSAARSSSGRVP